MFILEEILPENISVKWGKKESIGMKNTTTQEITTSTTFHTSVNRPCTAESTPEEQHGRGAPSALGHTALWQESWLWL